MAGLSLGNLFGGSVDTGADAIAQDSGQTALPSLFKQDSSKSQGDGTAEFNAAKIITGNDPLSGAIRGYLAAKGLKSAKDAASRKEVMDAVEQAVQQEAKKAAALKQKAEAFKTARDTGMANGRPIVYSNLPVLMASGGEPAERKKAIEDTVNSVFGPVFNMSGHRLVDVSVDASNPDKASMTVAAADGTTQVVPINSIKNTLVGMYPDDAIVQQWAGVGKSSNLETVGVVGDDGAITAQYVMRRPNGTFVGSDGQTPIDANRIVPIEAMKAQNSAGEGLGSPDAQRAGFNKLIQAVSPGGSLQNMSDNDLVAAQQHILTNPALVQSSEAGPLQAKIQTELDRRSRMTTGYNTSPQDGVQQAQTGSQQQFIGNAKSTPQDLQATADIVRSVAPMLALNKMLDSGTMNKAANFTGIPLVDQYLTKAALSTGTANAETAQYSQAANDARLGMQALVKGVPSNADQAIIDKIVPSEGDSQDVRRTKITAMIQVTKNLVSLNLQALKSQNKQIPPMLAQTAVALGIDPNSAGGDINALQSMTPDDATKYIMGDYAYGIATGNSGANKPAEINAPLSDKQKKALELLK